MSGKKGEDGTSTVLGASLRHCPSISECALYMCACACVFFCSSNVSMTVASAEKESWALFAAKTLCSNDDSLSHSHLLGDSATLTVVTSADPLIMCLSVCLSVCVSQAMHPRCLSYHPFSFVPRS